MIDALSGLDGITKGDLLLAAGMPWSTYDYARKHPPRPTRPELWEAVEEVFSRTPNGCGHRQVAMCLRAELGVRVADKTVLKVMREIGLRCGIRRRRGHRAYSSYMGRVGETFENLLGRDFSASRPWEKLATDVTEFVQPWGKAYLAPVLDLCGNRVVSWSISLSPNMEQQEEMLAGLWEAMPEGATPTLHSDMGWQYQHSGYVGQLRSHGVRQSMSRKGNCLDNACVEGFFGHLKDEFYRGREWPTFEGFRRDLEAYLTHWNLVRRQAALMCLPPVEYQRRVEAA